MLTAFGFDGLFKEDVRSILPLIKQKSLKSSKIHRDLAGFFLFFCKIMLFLRSFPVLRASGLVWLVTAAWVGKDWWAGERISIEE